MENNRNNSPSISPTAVVVAAAFLLISVIGINWFTTFIPDILPPQASAESKSVDELFYILMIIGGIVFFMIQGMLLISVIAFRARPGDHADGPTYHGNPILEIVWTIIPALVVGFLAVISFNVWTQNSAPKASVNMVNGESIDIKVTGARYAWTHNYETDRLDEDGDPIVINSSNKLHTYLGQNVYLSLQTQDVIHSYWVPAMRVKQDLLPGNPADGGRRTELRFTPIRVEGDSYPVEYPIVCAELCGDGHGRMTGTVVVYEDESQFLEQFYEPAIHAILNPPADPVLRGEIVIQEYICNSCHTLDSLEWSSRTGPSLNGIADRAGERVAGQSAEEYIANSVWNSQSFVVPGYDEQMAVFGPDQMDANEMSPEQLYSIVAFLCTQGEQSDCDLENITTSIPEAIKIAFDYDVDITFGMSEASETLPSSADGEEAGVEQAPVAEANEAEADVDEAESVSAADVDNRVDANEESDADAVQSNAAVSDAAASVDEAASEVSAAESDIEVPGVTIIVIGNCTLRDAIVAANEDKETGGCRAGQGADLIRLGADYVVREALPWIRSNITFDGGNHTISGGGENGIFSVEQDALATFRNLTFFNGSAQEGGAIHNRGTIIIDRCAFLNNLASVSGRAITNYGAATITDSVFAGNAAGEEGDTIFNAEDSTVSVINSSFGEDSAEIISSFSVEGDNVSVEDLKSITPGTSSNEAISSIIGGDFNLTGDVIRCGDSVTGYLSDDDWQHSWAFEGVAGQVIRALVMSSAEVDSYLVARGPDGNALQSNDNTGLTEIHIPTPEDAGIYGLPILETGTYQFEATGAGGSGGDTSGSYHLTLSCSESPEVRDLGEISCGETVSGTLNDADWLDEWEFESDGNQSISALMTPVGTGSLDSILMLRWPWGSFGVGNMPPESVADVTTDGEGSRFVDTDLPADTWFFIASRHEGAYGRSSGSYELHLECEPRQ